jgi:hypothetical protein
LCGRSFAFLYDRARAHPAAKLVEVRVYAEETAAQPEPGRAAASTSTPSAMSGDANHHAPVISPFDPLEARLEFARIEARRGKPTSPDDLITLLLEDEHGRALPILFLAGPTQQNTGVQSGDVTRVGGDDRP